VNVHAELTNDILVLETSLVRREYRWNGGYLCSCRLIDKRAGRAWEFDGTTPDCTFPGHPSSGPEGHMAISDLPALGARPACLNVETTCALQTLEVKRLSGFLRTVRPSPATCTFAARVPVPGGRNPPAATCGGRSGLRTA